MSGLDIASGMIRAAARIEREKQNRALTADEARMLAAVAFLRQIAPYLFEAPK